MENKSKYPIGGYAPGNYMCNCSTCKTQFQGDKRAVQCEPCAVKMVEKQKTAEKEHKEDNYNHLDWMYNRMIHVHNENPNYDYMVKFKEIINKFKK